MAAILLLLTSLGTAGDPPRVEGILWMAADDPAFARADIDTAGWTPIPASGLSLTASWEPVLWYRIELSIAEPDAGLAVNPGTLAAVHFQAFLNGSALTSGGDPVHLSDDIVSWLPVSWPLPAALLRPGRNVLAIRIVRPPGSPGGLLGDGVEVGPASALAARASLAARRKLFQQGGALGFALALMLLCVVLAWRGDVASRFLAGLAAGFLLVLVGMLDLAASLGSALPVRGAIAATGLMPFLLAGLTESLTRARVGRLTRALGLSGLPLVLAGLWVHELATLELVFLSGVVLHVAALVVSIVWVARSAGSVPDIWLMAIGLGAQLLAIVILMVRVDLGLDAALYPGDFGLSIIVVCGAIAVARRRARTLDEAHRAQHLARERERERIARELHDGTGPALTAVKLQLELLARRHPEPELALALSDAAGGVSAVGYELQRALLALRTPALDVGAELAVLKARARRAGVNVTLEMEDPDAARGSTGQHLIRIAQEAVNNALKHGGASRLGITLSRQDAELRLRIENDGPEPAQLTGIAGGGLEAMADRARQCGGVLEVTRSNGITRVEVRVPSG